MSKQKYFEEEEELSPPVDSSAGGMQELIFSKEDNEPRDKRTITWKKWRKEINDLMKEYNKKIGIKIYKEIK